MKRSKTEELVLGRSLNPLAVRINMYHDKHAIFPILVSMFGGCGEG
jgi:hypothetical protein